MKLQIPLAAVLLACLATVASAFDEEDADLSVDVPLTQVERACAAKLTRLRSARLWWNDDNRIVGASLKGIDANDRAVALASQLPGLRTLVLVALPTNHLTDRALASFAGHPELRLLSISGDRLTDSALSPIAANSSVEVLILNGNFTDSACGIISNLSNLTYLDLTQCHVTDAGLAQVPSLAQLETLILNGTEITSESMQSIVQLKRLTELYLGDTAIDDSAIEHFQGLQQLEKLFIKGTRITPEGVTRLLPLLPIGCRIIHDSGTDRGERVPQTASHQTVGNAWRSAR